MAKSNRVKSTQLLRKEKLGNDNVNPYKAPRIIRQPNAVVVNEGQRIRIQVNATGLPRPKFSWRHNGSPLDSVIGNVLVIPVARRNHQGSYIVEVSNCAGTVSSRMVSVTVNECVDSKEFVSVSVTPKEISALPGESFTFSAILSEPVKGIQYQWYKDGLPIRGATGPIFKVAHAKEKYIGGYSVVVTRGGSSAESSFAKLRLDYGEIETPEPTQPSMTLRFEDLGVRPLQAAADFDKESPATVASRPILPSQTKIIHLADLQQKMPTLTDIKAQAVTSPVAYGNWPAATTASSSTMDTDDLTGGFLDPSLLADDEKTIMVLQEDDQEATILLDPGDLDLSVGQTADELTAMLARIRPSKAAKAPVVSPNQGVAIAPGESNHAKDAKVAQLENARKARILPLENAPQAKVAQPETATPNVSASRPVRPAINPRLSAGDRKSTSAPVVRGKAAIAPLPETEDSVPRNVREIPSAIFRDLEVDGTRATNIAQKKRAPQISPVNLVAQHLDERKRLLRRKERLETLIGIARTKWNRAA